jgi:hypothetical protein
MIGQVVGLRFTHTILVCCPIIYTQIDIYIYRYSKLTFTLYKIFSSEYRMWILNDHNNKQMSIFVISLFISIDTTNGAVNLPNVAFHNRSVAVKQLLNRTTTFHSWKTSNSIEMLKKLIGNRHSLTKTNRTLLLTSKFHYIIRHPFKM